MNTKVCHTCKRELPATPQYFYKWIHGRDGLKASCKECQGGRFVEPKKPVPKGMKLCCDCGKLLPATEEYFNRIGTKLDGTLKFKSQCRVCSAKRSEAWRAENKEHYLQYAREYANTERGQEVNKRYRERNKEKIAAHKREYRERNKDKIKAYDHKRRYDPETREHILGMTRRWRANNKDHVAEYNRRYVEENPEYYIMAAEKRRHREMAAPNTLTLEQWEQAKAYFENCCAYCGRHLKRLTQDHFKPLSKGGGLEAGNIIPACRSCNSSKYNLEFDEWYPTSKYYTQERKEKILSYIYSMAIPRETPTAGEPVTHSK